MKKLLFLLSALISLEKQSSAQNLINAEEPNQTIDSIQFFLKSAQEDSNKVNALLDLSVELIGISNFEKANQHTKEALFLSQKLKYIKGQANGYFEMGLIYDYEGDYLNALKYYYASLKIFEAMQNKANIASCFNNVGGIYVKQKNYKDALKNHTAALEIRKSISDKQGMADSYNNIATIYFYDKKHDLALTNFIFALNINKAIDDKYGMIECYNNIGANFEELNYYGTSLNYYFNALKISKQIGDKFGIAVTFGNIGEIYLLTKKFDFAKKYLDSALVVSKDINSNELIKDHYEYFTKLDSCTNNWQDAFKHHKQYIIYRDKLINEENTKNAVQAQLQYEYGKKEATAKAEQEKKDTVAKEELKMQTLQRNGFIIGFALMIVLAGVSYRSYKRKRKDNVIITQQKVIVEQKNKEITQSIEYAKRIQNAILPSEKIIKYHLPNSFIVYKPKDIVAGDFYWIETTQSANQLVLFAACDCTGHGVPGAMVSVVCHNALNRAVREFGLTKPDEILNKVGEIVIENFSKSEEDIKDGMDVSLCVYNPQTRILEWAGANNPLWIVSNGKLLETKADKQPIGRYDFTHPFTNHTLQLNAGDTIYIFTDGFADQFGGAERQKKLTRRRFKELLLPMKHVSMEEQGKELDNFIINFSQGVDQIDDILVMGIRV